MPGCVTKRRFQNQVHIINSEILERVTVHEKPSVRYPVIISRATFTHCHPSLPGLLLWQEMPKFCSERICRGVLVDEQ